MLMGARKMLDIKDLSVKIKGKSVVKNVSFSLPQGRITSLIGESGSGKSMTVAALLNVLPAGGEATGSAVLNGRELLGNSNEKTALADKQQVFTIFQDALNSFNPSIKMKKQLYQFSGKKMGDSFSLFTNKMTAILKNLELSAGIMEQYPFELSGGMLQRCMIACAIYVKATVLIADEPTSSVDMLIKREFISLLKRLNKEEGTTVLLITHDLDVALEVADFLAVMYKGEIVETGKIEIVVRQAQHIYTKKLLHSSFGYRKGE
jgi:ABC-type glutathione transport system ATPase component